MDVGFALALASGGPDEDGIEWRCIPLALSSFSLYCQKFTSSVLPLAVRGLPFTGKHYSKSIGL